MIDKREIIDAATALGRTPHVSARVSRVALSVGAALKGLPHRIVWRSALYEHDLVVHPARSIQVATERRVRTRTLSGRGLQVLIEPPESLGVGRVPWGASCLSDRHRAVLDAAQRPRLVGGLEVLAEAFAAATSQQGRDWVLDGSRRSGKDSPRRLWGASALHCLSCFITAPHRVPPASAGR